MKIKARKAKCAGGRERKESREESNSLFERPL
jgi:hypothetical protein